MCLSQLDWNSWEKRSGRNTQHKIYVLYMYSYCLSFLSLSSLCLMIGNSVNHLRTSLQPSYPENNSLTPTSQICFFPLTIYNLGVKQCDNSYFSFCHHVYQFLEVLPLGETPDIITLWKPYFRLLFLIHQARVRPALLPAHSTGGAARSYPGREAAWGWQLLGTEPEPVPFSWHITELIKCHWLFPLGLKFALWPLHPLKTSHYIHNNILFIY